MHCNWRERIGAALCLSVAVHAGLAWWLADPRAMVAAVDASAPFGLLQVRLVSARDAMPADRVAARPAPPVSVAARLDASAVGESRDRPTLSPEYWPAASLDVAPRPRSEPDMRDLAATPATGLPIRLRLFVDVGGSVTDVRVLHASDLDREAAAQLAAMLRRTGFLPGKRDGQDVAAFQDLEFTLTQTLFDLRAGVVATGPLH